MRCDVVRFVAFEDLGVWEAELTAKGFTVRYLDAGVDDVSPAASADLAVVLGAPIDADDDARYPYLADVREVLAARLEANLPTLGICLGAQLMAMTFGGAVVRGTKEVGWAELTAPDSGRVVSSPWDALVGAPVLHWHGDTVELPPGAELVASTDATPHQVFVMGRQVAFQCHPEADPEAIERWLIGHTGDLTRWGIDLNVIRHQARTAGDDAVAAGLVALRAWLAHERLAG